jgi:hypothetical protein
MHCDSSLTHSPKHNIILALQSEVAVLDFKLREAREEAQKAVADANYAKRMSSSGANAAGPGGGRQRVSMGGSASTGGSVSASPPRDAAPAKVGRGGRGCKDGLAHLSTKGQSFVFP